MNAVSRGMTSAPEFDRLTGLLAFTRFKEEVSHKIIGGYAEATRSSTATSRTSNISTRNTATPPVISC